MCVCVRVCVCVCAWLRVCVCARVCEPNLCQFCLFIRISKFWRRRSYAHAAQAHNMWKIQYSVKMWLNLDDDAIYILFTTIHDMTQIISFFRCTHTYKQPTKTSWCAIETNCAAHKFPIPYNSYAAAFSKIWNALVAAPMRKCEFMFCEQIKKNVQTHFFSLSVVYENSLFVVCAACWTNFRNLHKQLCATAVLFQRWIIVLFFFESVSPLHLLLVVIQFGLLTIE